MAAALYRTPHLRRRHRKEGMFRGLCILSVILATTVLTVLLGSLIWQGIGGFMQTQIRLDITFSGDTLAPGGKVTDRKLKSANYQKFVYDALAAQFPEVTGFRDRRELNRLVSSAAGFTLRDRVLEDRSLIGRTESIWIAANADLDAFIKGKTTRETDPAIRRLSDKQLDWADRLMEQGRLELKFGSTFFTQADSREPERAGFAGAIAGSLLMLLVCFLFAFPVGVMAALYLEEFARRTKFSHFVEININNLAAVPSIIYGLLGLALYLGLLGMPRSSPLVGGLTLGLMILPVIIIATRASIAAVPPSIRDGARALGASPMQVVLHHVLPLALPGIMTGTILGLARAIGETAPLLMIGMVAFVADIPSGITDPASAMPVQIFLWSDSPESGFAEKTSAGILVLLCILVMMNLSAVWVRRKFERRW